MKRLPVLSLVILALIAGLMTYSCSERPTSVAGRLANWRNGIWITGGGTYTIWSDTHYFVISYEGDSLSPNVYCGASQVQYYDLGIAREQTIRVRKFPRDDFKLFRNTSFTADHTEAPMEPDTTLFTPGQCVIKVGVIYDAGRDECNRLTANIYVAKSSGESNECPVKVVKQLKITAII